MISQPQRQVKEAGGLGDVSDLVSGNRKGVLQRVLNVRIKEDPHEHRASSQDSKSG
jgi:hypothetical protein